jgi:hypothetical protein
MAYYDTFDDQLMTHDNDIRDMCDTLDLCHKCDTHGMCHTVTQCDTDTGTQKIKMQKNANNMTFDELNRRDTM